MVGNYFSMKQDHETAIQYFERALRVNRKYLSAWTLMGHEYVEMKSTRLAAECYRIAVTIDPRDYRAWYGLGQTFELLSMPLFALHYYRYVAARGRGGEEGQRSEWCGCMIGGCIGHGVLHMS